MATYRTPDVYVEEISVFPPSVAEVETAVPAFIGYTEDATRTTAGDLLLKPTKIYSLKEYEQHFGGPFAETIAVTVAGNAADGFTVDELLVRGAVPSDSTLPSYLMYYAAKLYFDNGGGKCYIVSVGPYDAAPAATSYTLGRVDGQPPGLLDGLDALSLEDEPTLVVVPEAVKLDANGWGTVAQQVLLQAGRLKDRFGIFDVRDGGVDLAVGTRLADARAQFGTSDLKYAAAYYPFLRTSLNYHQRPDDEPSNVSVTFTPAGAAAPTTSRLDQLQTAETAVYNFVKAALLGYYVVVPPSGGVAGVYAATDTNRGVWKAPANVSLRDVIEPVIRLDNAHQDDLNVDATAGKSINAIRAFAGKGTLVWGARTLAGNDNEWRYVNVRRFFNMVEESIKKSTYWAVFEPNDANTWVKVRGMIENYLTQKWREGALAGATTRDAFFVRCALGTTMNAQDILEGRMNVEIGMAVVRPAEFIILKFSHKLQTS